MMLFATLLAAAAATAETAGASGASSGWISGDTLTTILSILAGAGGVVGGKMWGEKSAKRIKADIPQPCTIEQSGYQAEMKANAADHADIFTRLRTVETEIAAVKATMTAKFDGLSSQLMETKDMVRQLFDRICKGRK